LLHMADPEYGRKQTLTYMPLDQFRVSKGGKDKVTKTQIRSVMLPYVSKSTTDQAAKPFIEQAGELEAQYKQDQAAEKMRAEAENIARKEAEEQARRDVLKDLSPEEQEARLLLDEYVAMEKNRQQDMTAKITALVEKATANSWPRNLKEYIEKTLKPTHYCEKSKKGADRNKKIAAMMEIK
jgi:hypothetical protein